MSTGYLYCISNKTIPGILRIGITYESSPLEYVKQLNNQKIKYATPFTLEFAKKIKKPKQHELALYALLEHFTIRIQPNKDVFKLNVEEAKMFFDLIDGDMWYKTNYKFTIIMIISVFMLCFMLYFA